jgi:hypothetical protein
MDATANPSRTVTIIGLSGIGLIHLLDSVDTYSETRWLFWAYVALIASTIIVGGALLHRPDARWLAAAALLAATPIAGFILSRTTGLPGADDDIGVWTEPLGLASLWVEGAVLATSSYALALLATTQRAAAHRRPLTLDTVES